jgi:hypothetical protein
VDTNVLQLTRRQLLSACITTGAALILPGTALAKAVPGNIDSVSPTVLQLSPSIVPVIQVGDVIRFHNRRINLETGQHSFYTHECLVVDPDESLTDGDFCSNTPIYRPTWTYVLDMRPSQIVYGSCWAKVSGGPLVMLLDDRLWRMDQYGQWEVANSV